MGGHEAGLGHLLRCTWQICCKVCMLSFPSEQCMRIKGTHALTCMLKRAYVGRTNVSEAKP